MKKRLTYPLLQMALLLVVLSGCATTGKIAQIRQRGVLLVGSTGDYRPLSYLEPSSRQYWGFDAEIAAIIGNQLGVEIQYVPTSWPTIT